MALCACESIRQLKLMLVQVWEGMPDDVDVLLTHVPPRGRANPSQIACSELRDRLKELTSPPRVHCFGHDHGTFGVSAEHGMLRINSAQEALLRQAVKKGLGKHKRAGAPLLFDLVAQG